MAGFKHWDELDILTAADLNSYLMDQVVVRFASIAARDAAIPTPADGQLCVVTGTGLYTGHGGAWILRDVNVRDFGADPTGVADSASAIQAACDLAAATGQTVKAEGTFTIASTVVIKGHFDGAAATFNYTGNGRAVQIGPGVSGVNFRDCVIVLPQIVCTTKPTTGWVAGTEGVRCINMHACQLTVQRVLGFETGLTLYGYGQGCCYSTITLMHLDNNKRNILLDADGTGWTNQNTFLGGRMSQDSPEGAAVAGVTHLRVNTTTNMINNNTFVGCSFEGSVGQYTLDFDSGQLNVFVNCRFEGTNGVRWGATAQQNTILYGFSASALNNTGGGGYNNIIHNKGGKRAVQGATGETVENSSSSNNPIWSVMDAGALAAGSDPATAYRAKLGASAASFKNAADAFIRYEVGSGGIKLGNGTVAPPITLQGTATAFVVSGGPITMGADNTYDIGAAGATRPRTVYAGTDIVAARVLKSQAANTASRPSAATVGAGGRYYDTTLNKPIWSDGTAWRDAAGTAV